MDRCEYPDCEAKATDVFAVPCDKLGYGPRIDFLCITHALEIERNCNEEGRPCHRRPIIPTVAAEPEQPMPEDICTDGSIAVA